MTFWEYTGNKKGKSKKKVRKAQKKENRDKFNVRTQNSAPQIDSLNVTV